MNFRPDICDDCVARQREQEEAAQQQAEPPDTRNIPQRYQSASFAGFGAETDPQARALVACRDHAAEGVFLSGGAGVGKTHLATCAIKDGPPGSLFVTTTELLDDFRASFNGEDFGLFERACVAPLLALDDLGIEKPTEFACERLHELLNVRYNDGLPLIVTTNRSPEELAERMGEAAISRIAALCKHKVVVDGRDHRLI